MILGFGPWHGSLKEFEVLCSLNTLGFQLKDTFSAIHTYIHNTFRTQSTQSSVSTKLNCTIKQNVCTHAHRREFTPTNHFRHTCAKHISSSNYFITNTCSLEIYMFIRALTPSYIRQHMQECACGHTLLHVSSLYKVRMKVCRKMTTVWCIESWVPSNSQQRFGLNRTKLNCKTVA